MAEWGYHEIDTLWDPGRDSSDDYGKSKGKKK